jgi:hypothetical protein
VLASGDASSAKQSSTLDASSPTLVVVIIAVLLMSDLALTGTNADRRSEALPWHESTWPGGTLLAAALAASRIRRTTASFVALRGGQSAIRR